MALVAISALRVIRGGRRLLSIDRCAFDSDVPTVILGPSGAGKSTLLRVLAGLTRMDVGRIDVDGMALGQMGKRAQARWFAWLPQLSAPQEWLSVMDYLLGARYAFDESRAASRREIEAALDACAVRELADAPVPRLSGGELQRVQLAGLLAQDARFLLLDEPANHLDPALVGWLHQWLAGRLASGQGLIAVSHDLALVTALETLTDRPVHVLGIRSGELLFDLRSDDPSFDGALEQLYGVPWLSLAAGDRRYLVPEIEPS